MTLGIYLGGTTGAADGTLEVPGDGIGLTLGVVGSVGTIHLRAASGKRNAEQVTVNAPTDCQVSADGTTYGATAVYAIGAIQDVNVAIYVKRTAGTTALTTGGTTTPRLALITEEVIPVPDTTAPVLSGTLYAIAGDGEVTLDWTDATDAVGVTGYDVEYGTTTGYGSSVSPDPTTSTVTITGLTNDTLYYFRVRAHDSANNLSGWITASATPTLVDQVWYRLNNAQGTRQGATRYLADTTLAGVNTSFQDSGFTGHAHFKAVVSKITAAGVITAIGETNVSGAITTDTSVALTYAMPAQTGWLTTDALLVTIHLIDDDGVTSRANRSWCLPQIGAGKSGLPAQTVTFDFIGGYSGGVASLAYGGTDWARASFMVGW